MYTVCMTYLVRNVDPIDSCKMLRKGRMCTCEVQMLQKSTFVWLNAGIYIYICILYIYIYI